MRGSEDRVRRVIELHATPEEVWSALTRPDQLARWFGAEAEIDVRPGGALRFTWPDGTVRRGLVEDSRAPEYLAFRWRAIGHSPEDLSAGSATRVEFLLERLAAGTRLTLVESPLSTPTAAPVGGELQLALAEGRT
ncbi:MAG: SRPBCC domain-containing protein [Actinomycetota bacterium]